MKKYFIYAGYCIITILLMLYLAFLFVLPNMVNLEKYIPLVQQVVKEQVNLNLEVKNPKIVTTPILEAGIKTDDIKITLADGSPVLLSDGLKVKVSLPWVLLMTVRVSCCDIMNPKIVLDTNDECTQYKLFSEIETLLNRKNSEIKDEEDNGFFNPEWIRVVVPHVKIKNYNVVVNDNKNHHSITLKGDEIKGGFFNFKKAKLKTYAYLKSDNNDNITANIKIDTFLNRPQKDILDEDDDKAEKIEIPFFNIVKIYQHYDLKAHINSKLKIRKTRNDKLKIKGFLFVDNFTLKLSKYQLPECYFHSIFHGKTANVDTNLYVTPDEHANIKGKINFHTPAIDLILKGNKVYFNNLILFSKAVLDSFGINNDLGNLRGRGYIQADAKIKTNFKNLKSEGKIIIRDGAAINDKIGLVVTGTNSDLLFDNNIFKIDKTKIFVSGKPLVINGTINNKAVADLYINTENLPIAGLYRALAPISLKNNIKMDSGEISVDAKINGKLKKSLSSLKFRLSNLAIRTKDNSFGVNNSSLNLIMMYDLTENILKGTISNKGLSINIPGTHSSVKNNNLQINFDNEKISITPTDIIINKSSVVKVNGLITDYLKSPLIDVTGDGKFVSDDLKQFAGADAAPYISSRGKLPVKLKITGNDKKQFALMQVLSNADNFITPVYFKSLRGVQCITQAKILYKGDRLNIKDTGIFITHNPFTNDYNANMSGAEPVIKLHGTLAKLDTLYPRVNILNLNIKPLEGTVYALRGSRFNIKGDVSVFGLLSNPFIYGGVDIDKISVPSLLTRINSTGVKFGGHSMRLFANAIDLNGSDLDLSAHSNFEFAPVPKLFKVEVSSTNFNLDRVMKVAESAGKNLPSAPKSSSSKSQTNDIPLEAIGTINFRKIQTGNIVLNNTRGNITLAHNILRIRPLSTNVFKGRVGGDIDVNLITNAIRMDLHGEGIDTEKALLDAANTKDALSGLTDFTIKAELKGTSYEEQMKSLIGNLHFSIKDGGFGPIGKIENLILAENIRNSQFFQTALGGIINNIATIDTAHFTELRGNINFKDGKAVLCPITSQGNVMSLHIAGDFDLLKNEADMKVRGRLGSFISNMLGPISALNPINLVKAAPGINVMMAKAFSLFTVSVTPDEMKVIPNFAKSTDDLSATKFQIVLRGDAAKPLSMIKSFKWLALQSDIDKAQNFTENLPEEYLLADPTTPEAQAAAAAKAKEKSRIINRIKRKMNIKIIE